MDEKVDGLDDLAFAKARRYMRALRRAILTYWYATIEDKEAALIEAANACMIVNILDESVFQASLPDTYRTSRATTPGGLVVMGLELIRNCETHAIVTFDDLLVEKRLHSVPLTDGGQVIRTLWHWASFDALPPGYLEVKTTATDRQKRARGEAQDGYRRSVQCRSVLETLFDAERFFTDIEPRLARSSTVRLDFAFAEVPQGGGTVLHRPLEHFTNASTLPDLATRWDERVAADAPPADQYVRNLFTRKTKDVPAADQRVVTDRITDGGKVIGLAGFTRCANASARWVERAAQIGRDIHNGYNYVLELGEVGVSLTADANLKLAATLDGIDLVGSLPVADAVYGLDYLQFVEAFPDMYVTMRNQCD
ncbi:hypothetical protein [Microbacterium candidum]|uniref:Uncharacterized protein n=1 Tax=Microbacterium candidum TaxID=3041922 RepID=A0ABT7MW05_9MICO|nr:hypothetical protein [Microbacterium sp. ASV49]MDL9978600.1 hypothetical protein [Microbacterium sp. ASV49]